MRKYSKKLIITIKIFRTHYEERKLGELNAHRSHESQKKQKKSASSLFDKSVNGCRSTKRKSNYEGKYMA